MKYLQWRPNQPFSNLFNVWFIRSHTKICLCHHFEMFIIEIATVTSKLNNINSFIRTTFNIFNQQLYSKSFSFFSSLLSNDLVAFILWLIEAIFSAGCRYPATNECRRFITGIYTVDVIDPWRTQWYMEMQTHY